MNGVSQGEEVVDQQVDGDGIFSRVVLPGAGQERLGEVEAGDPEGRGRTFVVPGLKERRKHVFSIQSLCTNPNVLLVETYNPVEALFIIRYVSVTMLMLI